MAQMGIREYDAKKMFFASHGKQYSGIQVKQDFGVLENLSETQTYVVKPDMLFGKRGKLGLLGVNLTKAEVKQWLEKNNNTSVEIDGVSGVLDVFLVEPFIAHTDEYYISFSAHRDYDRVSFSKIGGVDIESNWDQVQHLDILTGEKLHLENMKIFGDLDEKISNIILSLWNYYLKYGFVYLEVNPFCFDDASGDLVLLDMVAKLDDQQHFKQKLNWNTLEFPPSFGFSEQDSERYIRKLDESTGASLKFKILNPQAKIWTLTSGGGGSLVITDTLGALGFADEIGNYGELSGDPDFENTYAYTKTLLTQMLLSKHVEYLVVGGAIANFTNIAVSFEGIVAALAEVQQDFIERGIKILIRRGGINEQQGLKYIQSSCDEMGIDITVTGSDVYMTDILKQIKN